MIQLRDALTRCGAEAVGLDRRALTLCEPAFTVFANLWTLC